MKSVVIVLFWTVVTSFVLGGIEGSLGVGFALSVASVMLAWCLGAFWGAGDQIRKHRKDRGLDA